MEEIHPPLLPANYVTILDLRERWLKQKQQQQQQQQQEGKEEEEQLQKTSENEEQLTNNKIENAENPQFRKPNPNSKPRRWRSHHDQRKRATKECVAVKVNNPKEKEIDGPDQVKEEDDRTAKDEKKKKKKLNKWKEKKKNRRNNQEFQNSTPESQNLVAETENKECEKVEERENEEKDQTVEIERKMKVLSVRGNWRAGIRGGRSKVYRGYGRAEHRGYGMVKSERGLIWVKKGEVLEETTQ